MQIKICPRCKVEIRKGENVGESALYGSRGVGDLHEDCFLSEQDEIDAAGTNNIPDTLARYRK